MRCARGFARWCRAASCGLALTFGPVQVAQANTDAAAAQALWEKGKALLEQGRVVEACAKLDESYRLDPGTGTLLLLANCHEKEGKLASAWAELNEAAARARKEGGAEREAFAREQAAALAPRLSRLQIDVDATTGALAGLRVERNGVEVRHAAFGDAIPVDGGNYRVVANAPGHVPWETTVSVQGEGDRVLVTVRALAEAPEASPNEVTPAGPAKKGLSKMQVGGLVTAGVGVVGLGLSGFFALRAIDKKSQSNDAGCIGNDCNAAAAELRRSAVTAADIATGSLIAGGALLGVGASLFILGRRPSERTPSAALSVGPAGAALNVAGVF
jgi:hypothetical protein